MTGNIFESEKIKGDFPRISVDQLVISSPRKRIEPFVIEYSGLPKRTEARVDFPEPFGPIRAWISPLLIVRSIPLRILVPSSAEACKSLISNNGWLGFGTL